MSERLNCSQSLALVAALIDGKASRQALEVVLGYGNVPDPVEFQSSDREKRDNWRNALSSINVAVEGLIAELDTFEEQGEIGDVDVRESSGDYEYENDESIPEESVAS